MREVTHMETRHHKTKQRKAKHTTNSVQFKMIAKMMTMMCLKAVLKIKRRRSDYDTRIFTTMNLFKNILLITFLFLNFTQFGLLLA